MWILKLIIIDLFTTDIRCLTGFHNWKPFDDKYAKCEGRKGCRLHLRYPNKETKTLVEKLYNSK